MNDRNKERYLAGSRMSAQKFLERGFGISAEKIFAATEMYQKHLESLMVDTTINISGMTVCCHSLYGETRHSPAITFKDL